MFILQELTENSVVLLSLYLPANEVYWQKKFCQVNPVKHSTPEVTYRENLERSVVLYFPVQLVI